MVVLNTKKTLKTSMNARIIGSGEETLILAHGFGADQSIWDAIVPYLAQQYRVLVFDWLFSGAIKDPNAYDPIKYSSFDGYAKDLIDLVEEMELGPSVFIGHSMSGMIGCLASIERPHLFKKLVLVGASPRYLNAEDYEGGFEKPQIDEIILNIEKNFQAWASYFASVVVDPADPTSIEKFKNCLSRMKPETALSLGKIIFYGDHRDCLEKVETPCIIIQSSNDIIVPVSVGHYMQKKLKGKATVKMIEDIGHFPQLTKSKLLLEKFDIVLKDSDEEKDVLGKDSDEKMD